MSPAGWFQIVLFVTVVTALVVPLGGYMAKVFQGERTFIHPVIAPIERGVYRLAGVDPAKEQGWLGYTLCLLGFHLLGVIVLYSLLRAQGLLPLNPEHFKGMTPDLAFNTAISFPALTLAPILEQVSI
jgi:K+-transporting ATPase ATPase A chain